MAVTHPWCLVAPALIASHHHHCSKQCFKWVSQYIGFPFEQLASLKRAISKAENSMGWSWMLYWWGSNVMQSIIAREHKPALLWPCSSKRQQHAQLFYSFEAESNATWSKHETETSSLKRGWALIISSVSSFGNDDDAGSALFGIDLRRGLFMASVCSNTTFKQG